MGGVCVQLLFGIFLVIMLACMGGHQGLIFNIAIYELEGRERLMLKLDLQPVGDAFDTPGPDCLVSSWVVKYLHQRVENQECRDSRRGTMGKGWPRNSPLSTWSDDMTE